MTGKCMACVIALSSGCASAGKDSARWTPKPRVQWDQIVTHSVPSVPDNYLILTSEPTRGLFPAAIAVTRVALEAPDDGISQPRPRLIRDPRNEFLMWNSTFDTQMAISEVFSIDERDLGGNEANPLQIIAANSALGAGIALIYAVNELSETECEMLGALYDTMLAEPIATIEVTAQSPLLPKPDGDTDLHETDATALARSKFEGVVRECVRELIRTDQPAKIETPRGWTPAGSLAPAEWPPRRFRTGR